MNVRIWSLISLAFALGALPALGLAHHAFASQYSRDLPVEITGKVTKVEWTNPHARFYVDVENENGDVVNWNFELSSPNVLHRRGWRASSLEIGHQVTVTGFRARNDPHVANANGVVLDDGTRLFTGNVPDTD
jgi:hypothetical protein